MTQPSVNMDLIYLTLRKLQIPELRPDALHYLSVKSKNIPQIGILLYFSTGVVVALIHELISAYPYLSLNDIQPSIALRLCESMCLLDCIAADKNTNLLFIENNLLLYLIPFMKTESQSVSFKCLRLMSLSIVASLVKIINADTVIYLLQTEIMSVILHILKIDKELSQTIGVFILQKILSEPIGLAYICETEKRFNTFFNTIDNTLLDIEITTCYTLRLIRHVIQLYSIATSNEVAKKVIKKDCKSFVNNNILDLIYSDPTTIKEYENLNTLLNSE